MGTYITKDGSTKTFKNPHRISLTQTAQECGKSVDVLLKDATFDGVCPACCDEGCEVEPDGKCEHGCPSVLIVAGLI